MTRADFGIIQGNLPHDEADTPPATNPVAIGGRGRDNLPAPTSANDDRTVCLTDRFGRLITIGSLAEVLSTFGGHKVLTINTSTDVVLLTAPGAGMRLILKTMAASNGSSTLTRLDIKESTTTTFQQMYLAYTGGGFEHKYDPPIAIAANTAVMIALSPGVSDVRVNVGFSTETVPA